MVETSSSRFGATDVHDEEIPGKPRFGPGDWQFLIIAAIAVTILTAILLLLLF